MSTKTRGGAVRASDVTVRTHGSRAAEDGQQRRRSGLLPARPVPAGMLDALERPFVELKALSHRVVEEQTATDHHQAARHVVVVVVRKVIARLGDRVRSHRLQPHADHRRRPEDRDHRNRRSCSRHSWRSNDRHISTHTPSMRPRLDATPWLSQRDGSRWAARVAPACGAGDCSGALSGSGRTRSLQPVATAGAAR